MPFFCLWGILKVSAEYRGGLLSEKAGLWWAIPVTGKERVPDEFKMPGQKDPFKNLSRQPATAPEGPAFFERLL